MTKRLRVRGLSIVGEGSIYPLLGRLERDGLVDTYRAAGNGGPPRKYYRLTHDGQRVLAAGVSEWQAARDAVDCRAGPRRSGGTTVNDFVEQCRREWKRLRVPDRVADEMAADLAADLGEAEAEGASAEEVLGSGATDPRSFAASWAAERAVIPRPRLTTRLPGRPLMLAAIAALMVVTAIGAALVIFASPHAQAPKAAAIGVPRTPTPFAVAVSRVWVQRDGRFLLTLANGTGVAITGRPPSWGSPTLRLALPPPPSSVALSGMPRSGVQIHRVGSILLIVGIVGVIAFMLFLYRSSRARQDRATAPTQP